jgi:hypothetical protein
MGDALGLGKERAMADGIGQGTVDGGEAGARQ